MRGRLHGGPVDSGIVLTSYFTSSEDPQRNLMVKNNDFSYIKPLYVSAHDHSIPVVIFHDSLSDAFISEYQSKFVQFYKVSLRKTISMNDERFLFYQEYLRSNEIVEKFKFILLTDVSDVIFLRNPFTEFNIQQENRLQSSLEPCKAWILRENETTIKEMLPAMKDCYSSRSNFVNTNFNTRETVFNAGVIGGTVREVQKIVDSIIRELTRMDRGQNNCNMAALQYIIPREYKLDSICSKDMCWKEKCSEKPFIWHKPPANLL